MGLTKLLILSVHGERLLDTLNLNFKEIYKQIENLTASVESAKRHNKKNSEHEILLLEAVKQLIEKK